ncbi:hypothetical protein KAS42_02490 [bacterium]|nr:hypothetical protein [bacterium]
MALLTELIDVIDKPEGIDPQKVLHNCQVLLNEPNSHFLVAKIDGSIVGFVNLSIKILFSPIFF